MRTVVLLMTILMGLARPAAGGDVTAAQNLIRAQEQALAHDDAATAYSYASPDLHVLFPQADVFMSMVQRNYAPVYRHKSFEFGESRTADGKVAQRVHIIDANGDSWEALYTVEQQPDGSLKITGCQLIKSGQDV